MGTQSEFPGVLASLRDEFSSYAKVGGGTALSAKAGKEGLISTLLFPPFFFLKKICSIPTRKRQRQEQRKG